MGMPEPDPVAETARNYDADAAALAPLYLEPHRLEDVRRRFLRRLPAAATILDAGCGPGRDIAEFKRRGHRALGVDVSRQFALIAESLGNGPVLVASIDRLPLPNAIADGVWAAGSLVHLPHDRGRAALREFRRVSRAGGLLCVIVKQGTGELWRPGPGGTRSFVAGWTASELDAAMADAGYRVVSRRVRSERSSGPRLEWMAVAHEGRQLG